MVPEHTRNEFRAMIETVLGFILKQGREGMSMVVQS